jgi:hypothetical protein
MQPIIICIIRLNLEESHMPWSPSPQDPRALVLITLQRVLLIVT